MATNDSRTNFQQKRFMAQQRLEDSFFDYLNKKLDDLTSRIWGGERGVFGTATLVADGNDKFKVQVLPLDLLDADGNILTAEAANFEGIQFENANAIAYSVGARHVSIPKGVVRNPRNDVIFYDEFEDEVGEKANPDSILEVAGTLEIVVDSIFEAGISHAGRLVTVYLVVPLTDLESVAIERNLVVTWDGSNNKVTTAALLGQTGGSASTTPTDYEVIAQGVTVRKNPTDLSTTLPYAFLGTVTGGGAGNPPSGFSTVGQVDVSDGINPDLQEAYTAGRTIQPSAAYGGAVVIESFDSGDQFKSLLTLDRTGATEGGSLGAVALLQHDQAGSDGGAGFTALVPLSTTGGELQTAETVALANPSVGDLNFTRGGVDLNAALVDAESDLVLLYGFPTAAHNGLYKVVSKGSSTQLNVEKIDGTAGAPWTNAEAGNARIFRPVFSVASPAHAEGARGRASVTFRGMNDPSISPDVQRGAVNVHPGREDRGLVVGTGTSGSGVSVSRIWTTRDAQLFLKTLGKMEEVSPSSPPGDQWNAQMVVDRRGNTDWMQGQVQIRSSDVSGIPIAVWQRARAGGTLNEDEPITKSGATITFTRGGVDLRAIAHRITEQSHVVAISGSTNPVEDGLYVIAPGGVTGAATLTLQNLQGSAAAFTAEAATANVLMLRFGVANQRVHSNGTGSIDTASETGVMDWLQGLSYFCRDGQNLDAPLRVFGHGVGGPMLKLYDNSKSGATQYLPDNKPRELLVVDPSIIGTDQKYPFKFRRGMVVRGGNVTGGTGEETFYHRDGIRIWDAGGGIDTNYPTFALAVDRLFPEDTPTFDAEPAFAVDTDGGVARGHHFRDDFFYELSPAWLSGGVSNPPHNYFVFESAASTGLITPVEQGGSDDGGHGALKLTSGSVAFQSVELGISAKCMNYDTAKDFRWHMRWRLKLMSALANQYVRCGMNGTGLDDFFIYWNQSTLTWWVEYYDGATQQINTNVGATINTYQFFEIAIIGSNTVLWAIERKDGAASSGGSGIVSTGSFLTNNTGAGRPDLLVQTQTAAAKTVILDYWEWYDSQALYFRLGNSHNQNFS